MFKISVYNCENTCNPESLIMNYKNKLFLLIKEFNAHQRMIALI